MRQSVQRWPSVPSRAKRALCRGKRLLTGLLLALVLVLVAGVHRNAMGDAGGDKPKNLKILDKKLSRDDVKKYMKEKVTKAMGVQCDFCHNLDDMSLDTPKKKRAREMMQMVKDVNKKVFAGKELVGCVTCHRGKEKPDAK